MCPVMNYPFSIHTTLSLPPYRQQPLHDTVLNPLVANFKVADSSGLILEWPGISLF